MMFFASLKMMLLVSLAMMRCLPQCAVRHTSLGVAVIIGQRPASFAEGKHHSKKELLSTKSSFFVGGERGIRTLGRVLADTRFPVVRLRPAQPSLHLLSLRIFKRLNIIAQVVAVCQEVNQKFLEFF